MIYFNHTTTEARITELEAENARLRAQVVALRKLAYTVQETLPAMTALVEKRDSLAAAWVEANTDEVIEALRPLRAKELKEQLRHLNQ